MSIDLLRGFCILYIVGFWHLFNYTDAFPQFKNIITLRLTWIVLALFTFLSGYLIGQKENYLKKKSIKHFFLNRIKRIYPLYIVALILFVKLGISDTATTLKAAFAISMFFKPAPPTLWFITMLLFFYVLSPLLISNAKKECEHIVWIVYISVTIVLLTINCFTQNLDFRIITYFPSFYLGILTATMGEEYFNYKVNNFLLVAGTILSFVMNQDHLQYNWLLSTLMVSIASYYIFLLFKNYLKPIKRMNKIVKILAYSSYCMYLFHRPIYIVLKKIYFPDNGIVQILYLSLLCVPCILILSYYLQKTQDIINESLIG